MRSSSLSGAARFLTPAALLLSGLLLSGCGPDFDPPDQLHSLRVLGVQKDKPYAKPGETVTLQMLWEDASPNANGRQIDIKWTPPCFDPKGDLYYGCFSDPSTFGDMSRFGSGDSTSFKMRDDIISLRPPPTDSRNTAYGVAYVFFAACAGTLAPDPHAGSGALPVACLDSSGKPLGSDDFVAGYTAVYSYEEFGNENPVISGFEFNGQKLPDSAICLGTDCQMKAEAPPPDPADPASGIDCTTTPPDPRCIATCADDGKSSCHGYPLRPLVDRTDPANQEQDAVSVKQTGHSTGEQMWIDYYTDGGGFKSPVRLLNDATAGWNDNYGTDFYAPKDAKISRVWALVHDNRGGVAWAGISLKSQ